jgi:membrane-bound metal-dependent hydrolase YbcI (DUF457 family)
MASFLGHALGAVAIQQAGANLLPEKYRGWRGATIAALIGAIPDLDIVAYALLGLKAGSPHRGLSHSILFCTILAVAGFFIMNGRKAKRPLLAFLLLLFMANFHLFLDWGMKCGPPVKIFAPFSDAGFNSPVQFIPTAYYSTSLRGLLGVFYSPRSLLGVLLETGILGPFFLAFFLKNNECAVKAKTALFFLSAILLSGLSVWLTVYLYN